MNQPSAEVQAFLQHAASLAHEQAAPSSAADRFRLLLGHGLDALRQGSYGIAASYVVRGEGAEVTLFGHNTLAAGEPYGHAEMNALRLAIDVLRMPEAKRAHVLRELCGAGRAQVREVDQDEPTTELFSTLEPCPMCTVGAINAGLASVTYAHADPLAGSLGGDRLERLPPLWGRVAREQGLAVHRCQTERPEEQGTYVPAELLDALIELFEVSREPLDRKLAERGFFHPEELLRAATAQTTAR